MSSSINNDLILPLTSKKIEVRESKDTSCKSIVFKSTSKNIFAFSLDYQLSKGCKIFPFFNQSLGNINKVNDAIILCEKDSEYYLLLIELKSNNLGDYKKQLQAGKNFSLYIISMLNLVFAKNYEIKDENIRCLVASTRKTPRKQGSKRKNIKYEIVNGLNIAEINCNSTVQIEKFIEKLI
jgi:hypothetical protein